MNQKLKVMLPCLSILLCGCVGCRHTLFDTIARSTRVDPRNAYSLFAGVREPRAVPREVTDLQANGAAWMDMNVLCRFRAPTKIIDSIVANGYQRTNWETVATAMHFPDFTNSFVPSWNPDALHAKECYIQRVERDHGTDMLYLALDRQEGIVYAVGQGDAHD